MPSRPQLKKLLHTLKTKKTAAPIRNVQARGIVTVYMEEAALNRERVAKQNASREVRAAMAIKVRKRKKISRPVLSEIEFIKLHKIHRKRFNLMVKELKKFDRLRQKDRRTKGKIIANPEIIASFLREASVNLSEKKIMAFSNWAIGRDPSKLILLK